MITISRMNKVLSENSLRAFVDIVIDGKIEILGMRIIEIENKLLVKFPEKKTEKGEWINVIRLLDVDLRRELEYKILEEYNNPQL